MLRQSKGRFLFKSESLLEEFTWIHLEALLKLKKVKKQLIINKENRSDILGLNSEGRLAILELKKGGGRGSIDQLIRYRDGLKKEPPQLDEFSEVDLNKDFLLVAIASQFSKATKTYAQSQIPDCLLLTYKVDKKSDREYLMVFKTLDNKRYSQVKIEVSEDNLLDSLQVFIQGYLLERTEIEENVLEVIKLILSYSPDIQFDSDKTCDFNWLLFGKYDREEKLTLNKSCASFSWNSRKELPRKELELLLSVYLPTIDFNPRTYKRTRVVSGVHLRTDYFINVSEMWDRNVASSRMRNASLRYPLKNREIDEIFDNFEDYYINYRKTEPSRKKLRPVQHSDFTTVKGMVKMALEDWSVR